MIAPNVGAIDIGKLVLNFINARAGGRASLICFSAVLLICFEDNIQMFSRVVPDCCSFAGWLI